ncbi:hypothetical protein R1flu_001775 [Riccia fluitans]|uniref:Uncharacterized protein n=1 Tax=Riccia fluitans TaxID=41844 RepID=A0ABD1Y490_9MARC
MTLNVMERSMLSEGYKNSSSYVSHGGVSRELISAANFQNPHWAIRNYGTHDLRGALVFTGKAMYSLIQSCRESSLFPRAAVP